MDIQRFRAALWLNGPSLALIEASAEEARELKALWRLPSEPWRRIRCAGRRHSISQLAWHELAGGRCGHRGASRPRGRGVPRGAATLLLDRVRVAAGQGAAAAGVALRLEEDAAGRGDCVASGGEAGAGG